jgi:hypothetical protein
MFEVEVQRKGNTDDTDKTDFHRCAVWEHSCEARVKRAMEKVPSFESWVLSREMKRRGRRRAQ